YLFDKKQFYFFTVSIDISEISKISENSLSDGLVLRQNGTRWGGRIQLSAGRISGSVKAVRKIAQVKLRQRALLLQGLKGIVEGVHERRILLCYGDGEAAAKKLRRKIRASCKSAACMTFGTVQPQ